MEHPELNSNWISLNIKKTLFYKSLNTNSRFITISDTQWNCQLQTVTEICNFKQTLNKAFIKIVIFHNNLKNPYLNKYTILTAAKTYFTFFNAGSHCALCVCACLRACERASVRACEYPWVRKCLRKGISEYLRKASNTTECMSVCVVVVVVVKEKIVNGNKKLTCPNQSRGSGSGSFCYFLLLSATFCYFLLLSATFCLSLPIHKLRMCVRQSL